MSVKIYEPPASVSGASIYKTEVIADGVFVFRKLQKNEAEAVPKNERWKIDDDGYLYLYKIDTEEHAKMAIESYWGAIKKFNKRFKKLGYSDFSIEEICNV